MSKYQKLFAIFQIEDSATKMKDVENLMLSDEDILSYGFVNACALGHLDIVKYFASKMCHNDIVNQIGVITLAIGNKHLHIVDYLLSRVLLVDIEQNVNNDMLMKVIASKGEDITKYCIDRKLINTSQDDLLYFLRNCVHLVPMGIAHVSKNCGTCQQIYASCVYIMKNYSHVIDANEL